MTSRLMRLLLKLYPRCIRDRYGDELLDLQSELTAQREVSRTRLIWDMLAGALLVRPGRQRAHLVVGGVLVVGGLAMAGTLIGEYHSGWSARPPHPRARLAVQRRPAISHGSCFVAAESSCVLNPCTEFTVVRASEGAVVLILSPPAEGGLPRTRCAGYPHVRLRHSIFVSE